MSEPFVAVLTDEGLEAIVHVVGCPGWHRMAPADCPYQEIHHDDVIARGPAIREALTTAGGVVPLTRGPDSVDELRGWLRTRSPDVSLDEIRAHIEARLG